MEGTHDGATRAAIVEVMRTVRAVGKDDVNEAQQFKFRGIDAVLNAVGPALRDHGVTVMPWVEDIKHDIRLSRNDKSVNHYVVQMQYTFQVPHGEMLTMRSAGEAMDAGDKGLSKAMSVAYRVGLIQMLALPTGDKDPDHDVYEMDEPQGQTYGAPAPRAESNEAVNVLRKEILRVLTSRKPPWTLNQIEGDFNLQIGGQIRDAPADRLQAYLDMVKQ